MEFNRSHKPGKSRLSDSHLDRLRNEANPDLLTESALESKKKATPIKLGLVFFILFILLVIVSVFLRMYSPNSQLDSDLVEEQGEEVVMEKTTMDILDKAGVDISREEIAYEEPERIYHIEKRQQFCAKDIEQARDLYSEYVGVKNQQVLSVRPSDISEEEWIKEKKVQGAYRENLGERETDYYYEYPTTAGPYVDLMRIHKCEVFNPGGRIIPIISIDEDGFIPEYELGVINLENLSEDEMVDYIQYLISLRHDSNKIEKTTMKSSGDYLTLTLEVSYDGADDLLELDDNQELYEESVYKLNLKTGLLKYSAELLIREIKGEVETTEPLE